MFKKIKISRKVILKILHNVIESIKKNPILASVILLALLLRVVGFYPGFSESYSDEGTSYGRAVSMLIHNLKPDFFDYPAGMAFMHLLVYIAIFIPISFFILVVFHFDKFFELLKHIGEPYFINTLIAYIFGNNLIHAMYWTRLIAAFFGTGAVVLAYLVGKKFFNKETGIFAAFFLAVNHRHVLGSHFGLPDVHNSFFGLLSILAALFVFEKNSRKRYIFAGIASGLMFSIKYQVFGFLPLITAHVFWAIKKRNFFYLFHPNIFLAGLTMIAVFILLNPYYLFNLESAAASNLQDYGRYQMGNIEIRPYHYYYLFNFGIGRLPVIAIIGGLILGLFLRFKKTMLLLAFALPILFVLTLWSNGGIFPRNFQTVTACLMVFAGLLFSQVFADLKNRFGIWGIYATIILLFIVNLKPLIDSSILAYALAQPFNSVKLAEWIREKLPKEATVRSYPNDGNIRYAFKDKGITWQYWLYDKRYNTLSEFQDEGTDFAILNTATLQNVTHWWRQSLPTNVLFSYSTVPFDFIENAFFGLTVREFMQYTVFESYKPPQVLEQHAFLVFKIPQRPKEIGDKVASFNFDSDVQNWKITGNYGLAPARANWDNKEGSLQSGSIAFSSGESQTSRIVFSPLPITSGKFYTIKGYLKNSQKSSDSEADGFLRVDFYANNKEETLSKKSLAVAISQQAPLNGQWQQVIVSMRAPEGARYLTIGFQRRIGAGITYIDDIDVFETEKLPEEPFKEIPYIRSTIPLEGLYYDSFL